MNSAVFDAAGRCLCVVNMEVEVSDHPGAAIVVLSETEPNPNLVWYDFADNRMKDVSPFAVRVTTNTVANIPPGTTVAVSGQTYQVEDGTFTITATYPELVTINLSHPHFYDMMVRVPCEPRP